MLGDFLTELSSKYHDLGHIHPAIDQMMDGGGGFGHRVDFGHDLDGLLRAYDLDGHDGVHAWADHMLKDFTSPAGVPLPFSEALVRLTPLDMQDAVDWLSVNFADVAEVGAEALAVEVIARRFGGNRAAYHAALAVGMALGFVDDNPLLIAYSGARWLIHARDRLAAMHPDLARSASAALARAASRFEAASYIALGAQVVAHALHVPDLLDAWAGAHLSEHGGAVADGALDLVDGLATFGVALGARRLVRALCNAARGVKQRDAARMARQVLPKVRLVELLAAGAPPTALVGPLAAMAGGNGRRLG
ncbi:MAG: hypothetical protein GX446_05180 [Chthonomonadales bacterium]|nr:hypothetical protein [Chthonomonadales bacterium]